MTESINDAPKEIIMEEFELVKKLRGICSQINSQVDDMRIIIDGLRPNDSLTLQSRNYAQKECAEIRSRLLKIANVKIGSRVKPTSIIKLG